MQNILIVGIGGLMGTIIRYLIGLSFKNAGTFPWATLLINVTGSFLLGLLVARVSHPQYLLWCIGFLGAFTTFSTFSVETMQMLSEGRYLPGMLYVLLSVLLGVGAAALGFAMRH